MKTPLFVVFVSLSAVGATFATTAPPVPAGGGLLWDPDTATCFPPPEVTDVKLEFPVTNPMAVPITITGIHPGCGCTTTRTPALPWTLAPGARGIMGVTIDIKGKRGDLTKTIRIDSTAGGRTLVVRIHLPADGQSTGRDRDRERRVSTADRQAVFRVPSCAACHARGLRPLRGRALFGATCAVCHESPNRAGMVPDLSAPASPRNAAYWRSWISDGRPGMLMPAFSKARGGPLDEAQISSLVSYALGAFPGQR